MINAMKVGEHRKKWAKNLSGGTKRKVSCSFTFLQQRLLNVTVFHPAARYNKINTLVYILPVDCDFRDDNCHRL